MSLHEFLLLVDELLELLLGVLLELIEKGVFNLVLLFEDQFPQACGNVGYFQRNDHLPVLVPQQELVEESHLIQFLQQAVLIIDGQQGHQELLLFPLQLPCFHLYHHLVLVWEIVVRRGGASVYFHSSNLKLGLVVAEELSARVLVFGVWEVTESISQAHFDAFSSHANVVVEHIILMFMFFLIVSPLVNDLEATGVCFAGTIYQEVVQVTHNVEIHLGSHHHRFLAIITFPLIELGNQIRITHQLVFEDLLEQMELRKVV